VPVAQIVDAFEKRKNDGCRRSNCDMMLDCEMEIKGIVKKVVKFFNEFAERQIQSKTKRKRLKERLNRKKQQQQIIATTTKPTPIENSTAQIQKQHVLDPAQIMRDSIRVPIWQWRLQGGRQPIILRDGSELRLTDQPVSASYNEARDALRKQLPGDQLYHKRDFFRRLPDHVLVAIFTQLNRRDLANIKLVCRDFAWIIAQFDILAGDSGWHRGEPYREDRCKWCKRKRQRGDASLCRYHPKAFVGDPVTTRRFYMCCRAQNKIAPGCQIRPSHDNFLVTEASEGGHHSTSKCVKRT